MQLQSAQTLINWYLEIAESKGVKMPIAMLGCPGLNSLLQLPAEAEVRGMWVLPGGQQSIVVSGSAAYRVGVSLTGTPTNPPALTATQIGTLLTTTGPVVIRDNGDVFGGEGGFAVIVDGQFGYYYALPGTPTSVNFTGTTTGGSNQIQTVIPNGLVVGPDAMLTGTNIPPGTLFTGADFNVPAVNMSQAATGSGTGSFTISFPTFGQITDPAFLPASRVAFIEGFLIFNQVNSRTFFTTAATPYTLLFDASFYALKDSSTDNLVTLYENNRELWLIGERTSEVWYNAGGANFSFSRVPAVGPQIGCAAQHSITRVGPQLLWLASNEQGENIVVTGSEYSWERLSTHAVEHSIAQYTLVNDAIGYGYQEEGHWFYVLLFPSANTTWVYDMSSKMWHQRASWENSQYIRHRSNCFMNIGNARVVGDFENGQLYQMSRQFYTDNGAIIRCQRRTGPIWAPETRKRVYHGWLQVEFTPGVGSNVAPDPKAMLRWSNDGGFSWSNEYWQSIGRIGKTLRRAIWRRLGFARQKVYELNFDAPVPRDIIGATLFFEPEVEDQENPQS